MGIIRSISHGINSRYKDKTPSEVVVRTLFGVALFHYGRKFVENVCSKGLKNALTGYALGVVSILGVDAGVKDSMREEVIQSMIPKVVLESEVNSELPEEGMSHERLLSTLKEWSGAEQEIWGTGQSSGAIYHGGDALLKTLTEAYSLFALSNPLHPELFPWVRKMEAEVVRMTLGLFHGDALACGSMTSGGTESILMAIKAYRDEARVKRGIFAPEMIASNTAHAAFDKAANYFGIKLISLSPMPGSLELDPVDVEKAITSNTICIVASAPNFPHGVVDPIPQLGALALKYKLGLHVDCCLGSFLIPFAQQFGCNIPNFDFLVPGVTSISADTHKYGFAPKGSSVIMFKNEALRHYMYYVSTSWTGGVYASPTITGSRPGALIASTWAALMALGKKGYQTHMTAILQASTHIRGGLENIDGVQIVGNSQLSVIAFTTTNCDIYAVSSAMSKKGWHQNALQNPKCVHLCVTYANHANCDQFLTDLQMCMHDVLTNPSKFKGGAVQIYGLAEAIGHETDATGNNTGLLADMAKIYIDTLTYIPKK